MRYLIAMLLMGNLYAEDLYVTQSGTGAGTSCIDSLPVAWLNTAGNWGAGSSKVSPGDTVHLCGTFTGTAAQTLITIPGSGSVGSPVAVLFEPDAVLEAPYWGGEYHGAIDIIGKSYITIDGGTNGIIRNTANGTALANQQPSQGIYLNATIGVEIKNLSILSIYANGGSNPDATDGGGAESNNIRVRGATSGLSVNHNILRASRAGVRVEFDGAALSDIAIHHNLITDHCWGITFGAGNGGESTSGIEIYNNEFTDWLNWQCPANAAYCTDKTDYYHTDGIILYSRRGSPIAASIYSNYFHGTLGNASPTAFVYCTFGGGTTGVGSICNIYNNLMVEDSGRKANWMLSTGGNTGPHLIANNTFIGQDTTGGVAMMLSGSGITLSNNIIKNKKLGISSYETTVPLIASNNNTWLLQSGSKFSSNDGASYYTWAAWQALGWDADSLTSDPLLTAACDLAPGSPAIRAGANLTSLGITALNSDKSGRARPATGAWDIGAYQYIAPRGFSGKASFSGGSIK